VLKWAKQVSDVYRVTEEQAFSGGRNGEIAKYLQQASQLALQEKSEYLAAQTVPGSIASDGVFIGKRDMMNTVLVTQDGVFILKSTGKRKGGDFLAADLIAVLQDIGRNPLFQFLYRIQNCIRA
jgi:hypothetical protein